MQLSCEVIKKDILQILGTYVSRITAQAVLKNATSKCKSAAAGLDDQRLSPSFIDCLVDGLKLYCLDRTKRERCREQLKGLSTRLGGAELMGANLDIETEENIVLARRMARNLTSELGFNTTQQMGVVTVVSELTRNIFRYAGSGSIKIEPVNEPRRGIHIVATDNGPGIVNLDEIMGGRYQSKTGMGLGLLGCKRLMDEFNIDTGPGRGTTVTVSKFLQ